ncbi:SDR family NAD(P)-dependent oxidoreductase [Reinekea blandensis]|uniref:Short chain dehydrogenase n=1 Tax=Reinekea blandensis MED297 TaxID=314283 RepID=A4BBD5_9GAMM|nr:SDR family NAD(P)-dependent oxidoreductase [Reinekea blandensis]EAR10748.1 short chain dehydrogenase [Reinekea sp. MED297] [Reinekea blandensis MED297]
MMSSNAVALITGAANGLGWGLAQHYARQGYDLLLVDRDQMTLESRLQHLQQHGCAADQRLAGLAVDLTDNQATKQILQTLRQTFGRLDVLMNNAGITHRSLADETEIAVTERVMTLDFMVPVRLTQQCLPLLESQQHRQTPGTVINIGSMAGWLPVMGRSGYCAAKGALHQYFETLRAETAHRPLHILMVYPSFLATDIERNALSGTGQPAKHQRSTIGSIHSVDWMVQRIADAHRKRQDRLFPNRSIALAALFYRVMPSLFIRLMRRKFRSELNPERTA